jgi:hypothetical protein
MSKRKYEVGQTFERWTPFIVEDRDIADISEDGIGCVTIKSWRPGIRHEQIAIDDTKPVWDGEGAELRRIVSIAKVDDGSSRVLYRRTWRRPDGGEFGKARVRMTTASAFTSWINETNSGLRRELNQWREEEKEAPVLEMQS